MNPIDNSTSTPTTPTTTQSASVIAPNKVCATATENAIYDKLSSQLSIKPKQVKAFVKLIDDGATVPFIARYRKEETGGLDDTQLRALEKGLSYERDMAKRRTKIIELLANQGKLTTELQTRIDKATSKLELEDIYLPYRPRRRSLAAKARLVGLDSHAQRLKNEEISPLLALSDYEFPATITDESGSEVAIDLNDNEFKDFDFTQTDKQLAGLEAIIIDDWTQELDLLDNLRKGFAKTAQITSTLISEDKREVGKKFSDYFEHTESMARLPNHRLLAMLRGRQENVLTLKVEGEDTPFIDRIIDHFNIQDTAPAERREFLTEASNSLWRDKWRPHIEHRLLTEKRLVAEADAIDVFANNLQHLLMAAPAGPKVILGVDPGIRHGVKMAVIDANGHVIYDAESKGSANDSNNNNNSSDDDNTDNNAENADMASNETESSADTNGKQPAIATVYPFAPDNKRKEAKETIANLLKRYAVDLVAIGNGTASRETDTLIKEVINEDDAINATTVMVNEAGASVYSASELASDELGDLDVSIRGAVSIARRLQDPLSELVKVEPKAIGVGQYQHDVNQSQLNDSLDKVIQDSVNAVGVDVNTASPAILTYIAGLNRNVAQQIVNYRKEHGAFNTREALKSVPRLGIKTFEQAAGFLRIRNGDEPLDATGIHPESYDMVKNMLANAGKSLSDVLGNDGVIQSLSVAANDENVTDTENTDSDELNKVPSDTNLGVLAIKQELAKPNHDPRPKFKTAQFRDDVNSISDLEVGMQLEGVVTNVTAFGCFVDVGVHQDGLVHISQMANEFVDDPMSKVKPGEIVSVRVIAVDEARGRIGFSMRPEKQAGDKPQRHKPDAQQKPVATRRTSGSNKDTTSTRDTKMPSNTEGRTKPSDQDRRGPKTGANRTNNRTSQSKQPTRATQSDRRSKSSERSQQNERTAPQKIGSLGALLKEAGLK